MPLSAGRSRRRPRTTTFYSATKHNWSRWQKGFSMHYHLNQLSSLTEQGAWLLNQGARSYQVCLCLIQIGRRHQYKRPHVAPGKVTRSFPINLKTIQVSPLTWPSERFLGIPSRRTANGSSLLWPCRFIGVIRISKEHHWKSRSHHTRTSIKSTRWKQLFVHVNHTQLNTYNHMWLNV